MTLSQLAFLLFVVTCTSVTSASTHDLHWKNHYGTAKRTAQAAKRPLVVVIEHSDQGADKIDDESLDGKSREKLANEDFELVKVDAKTAYGMRVAEAFGVQQFPYTAVTDDVSERIVFRKSGPMSQSDWTVALAKSAETKTLDSQVGTEKVVVQKPIVTTGIPTSGIQQVYDDSQPAIQSFQPQVTVVQPSTYAQPQIQPAFQNLVSPQIFAPNGLYQVPSQCLT